jgi:hypothetical protein
MNKIRDLTEKIFSGLFFFAITYFFLGQFALDWGISTRKFYENRNQYIKCFIKLDSTSYGYSEGSTSTNPYVHGRINGKVFIYESYNNIENQAIADTIELNNHPIVKKVWYHKEGHGSLVYSILFGEMFPWQQSALRHVPQGMSKLDKIGFPIQFYYF